MSKNIFITGTGTDIGKTYVTGLIVKRIIQSGKKAAYYKAAMSGNERNSDGKLIPGDALEVKKISGTEQPEDLMCPYVYENAFSPHLASRIEENPVDMDVVVSNFDDLRDKYDFITVEGRGGILCPLRFDGQIIRLEDVIKKLGLSCLIIADAGLGTINNVVLTVEYMKSRNINVKGIIFNHFHSGNIMEEDNLKMCEYMTGIKVIACVKENDNEIDIDTDFLESLYE